MAHHGVRLPTIEEVSIPDGHLWTKLPVVLLVTGLLALVGAYVAAEDHYGFSYAYLVGFLYAATFALGSLFFVLVQHAARAGWSPAVRRIAEAMMATLPALIVLFIPLYLMRHDLYGHWMSAEHVAHDPILKGKEPYLNEGFWTIRAALYLVVWSLLGVWFWRTSVKQDTAGDAQTARGLTLLLEKRSYPMIAVFAVSVSVCAIDLGMSLDPHWFSTMWGVWYFAGSAMVGFAFLGLNVLLLQKAGLLRKLITTEHHHDIGKLTFAFTIFWAYISFSQFFLIWYSNIPEETTYFHHRMGEGSGGWETIGLILMICHFGIPFFLLMPRTIKRKASTLLAFCIYMPLIHLVDICYAVLPANAHAQGTITVSAILCGLGMLALVWGAGIFLMKQAALMPVQDPRLPESLAFQNF